MKKFVRNLNNYCNKYNNFNSKLLNRTHNIYFTSKHFQSTLTFDNEDNQKALLNHPSQTFEIVFIGTGSIFSNGFRSENCTALNLGPEIWLYNCSVDIIKKISYFKRLNKRSITKIFVTSLDISFIAGLPMFIFYSSSQSHRHLEESMEPITIYGPKGLYNYIASSFYHSKTIILRPIIIFELVNDTHILPKKFSIDKSFSSNIKLEYIYPINNQWICEKTKQISVVACMTGQLYTCFSYVTTECDFPGKVNTDSCKKFGILNTSYIQTLKMGESVLYKGVTIKPEDILEPTQSGRKFVLAHSHKESDELKQLSLNADVLVHNTSLVVSNREILSYNDISPMELAVKIYTQSKIKRIFLNQIMSKYLQFPILNNSNSFSQYEILELFNLISNNQNCKVYLAFDKYSVLVPIGGYNEDTKDVVYVQSITNYSELHKLLANSRNNQNLL